MCVPSYLKQEKHYQPKCPQKILRFATISKIEFYSVFKNIMNQNKKSSPHIFNNLHLTKNMFSLDLRQSHKWNFSGGTGSRAKGNDDVCKNEE